MPAKHSNGEGSISWDKQRKRWRVRITVRTGDPGDPLRFRTIDRTKTRDAAHKIYDPESESVRPRPDWFLLAVADLENRPEDSFIRA